MNELMQKLLETLTEEQKQTLLESIMNSIAKTSDKKEEKPVYKRVPPKQTDKNDSDLFIMKQENKKLKKQPVTDRQRFNKFKDTGSEHKDEINQTPNVELTERRRPAYKKIKQTCTRCNKTVEVHQQHARDFFVCDSCLRR
jgi:uncharacterized membrane-anchored protein YjiN (DUF445 family)